MDQAQDRVSGHLQAKGGKGARKWYALFRDRDGRRHQLLLGPAHVKESGRRTERGAVVWRAASGPRPTPEHLTPLDAQAALDELSAADAQKAARRFSREEAQVALEHEQHGKARKTVLDVLEKAAAR